MRAKFLQYYAYLQMKVYYLDLPDRFNNKESKNNWIVIWYYNSLRSYANLE